MSKQKFETKREKELRKKLEERVADLEIYGSVRHLRVRIIDAVMALLKEEQITTGPLPSSTIARDELRRGGQ